MLSTVSSHPCHHLCKLSMVYLIININICFSHHFINFICSRLYQVCHPMEKLYYTHMAFATLIKYACVSLTSSSLCLSFALPSLSLQVNPLCHCHLHLPSSSYPVRFFLAEFITVPSSFVVRVLAPSLSKSEQTLDPEIYSSVSWRVMLLSGTQFPRHNHTINQLACPTQTLIRFYLKSVS